MRRHPEVRLLDLAGGTAQITAAEHNYSRVRGTDPRGCSVLASDRQAKGRQARAQKALEPKESDLRIYIFIR